MLPARSRVPAAAARARCSTSLRLRRDYPLNFAFGRNATPRHAGVDQLISPSRSSKRQPRGEALLHSASRGASRVGLLPAREAARTHLQDNSVLEVALDDLPAQTADSPGSERAFEMAVRQFMLRQ